MLAKAWTTPATKGEDSACSESQGQGDVNHGYTTGQEAQVVILEHSLIWKQVFTARHRAFISFFPLSLSSVSPPLDIAF